MKDIKKYIASGILELYVAGALPPEKNLEVQHYALKHPEIRKEIEAIETGILKLTEAASPGMPDDGFSNVMDELNDVIPFEPEASNQRKPWLEYIGWAASLLFAAGLLWLFVENNRLKGEMEVVNQEKQTLQEQILQARETITDREATQALLNELRNKNVNVIALEGQAAAPNSYAKAYWNKAQQKVFIDAQGLPEPPEGFAYQVWSLKLEPLTPTSIGLLDDFATNGNKVFELKNANASEAFGITLEPEDGSESPSLEQLYTLGTINP